MTAGGGALRRVGNALAVAVLAAAVVAATAVSPMVRPASAAESYVPVNGAFAMSGLGYGHGRGLSQWGAYGAARQGVSAAGILDFYYPGTATAGYGDPVLRVQLRGDEGIDLVVSATTRNGTYGVIDLGSAKRDMPLPSSVDGWAVSHWRSVAAGGGTSRFEGLWAGAWRGYPTAEPWVTDGPLEMVSSTARLALVYPDGTSRDYRGSLRSVPNGAGLHSLSIVPMEAYLRSVVPSEVPATWPAAAVEAQSVAARTYTANVRTPSGPYDICDTTACQVYSGVATYDAAGNLVRSHEHAASDRAVLATAGQIRTYGGKPIFSQFSAANGGWTLGGTTAQPYLPSKPDPYDGAYPNAGHSWTLSLSADKVAAAYGTGRVLSLSVDSRDGKGTWGGRTRSVTVRGTQRTVTVTGDAFRSALGLRSTWWTVTGSPPAPDLPADLHAVLLQGGASGAVELHSLSSDSGYREFSGHHATAFGLADPSEWRFLVAPGTHDLYGVKLRGTASGRVEVHVLSAASGYRTFSGHHATAQPVLPVGMATDVALAPWPGGSAADVYLIPTSATGSGRVEVHVLAASSGYTSFRAHLATALPTTTVRPGEWSFLVSEAGAGGDLVGVWHSGATGSGRTEVHTLTQSSGYSSFSRQVATPVALSQPGFSFSLGERDGDGEPELFVLSRRATGTGSTEVHVLSGAAAFTTWALHTGTALGETGPGWQLDIS
jgi:SpoIID/LytB domain protein